MSLVTYGLGQTNPPLLFLMRAYHTASPVGYIYWTVEDAPDMTAVFAPYALSDLTSIIVAYAYPQQTSI